MSAPGMVSGEPLTSLVWRLTRAQKDAVRALSKRIRVPYSVLMREALADLLAKYPAPEVTP